MTDENKFPPENNFPKGYEVPDVWQWEEPNGGEFASTNKPTAGAQFDQELPKGKHPLQLHSMATPNGVKITIMLEELLALGHEGAEYDAYPIKIGKGDQFGSGFVELNPNSKIPALLDTTNDMRIFESGSILLYLAEKFGEFLPTDVKAKTEVMNWLFWQMGSAPYLGGGFGHFYNYAPIKIQYCIDRFSMETKRQLDVLDKQLANNKFIAGDEYSIADIAIWPWYGGLALGYLYEGSDKFLEVDKYKNLVRWAKEIGERKAVKRGRVVNKLRGPEDQQLHERHTASDIDKLGL